MTAIHEHPAPTVAAVHGHAIAGGCVLAQACDLRVMTTSPAARIGVNEVAIGLQFPPRVLALVRARVPAHHRRKIFLEAGLYDPSEALRLGLVDELAEDAVATARARLERLALHPRDAYVATKRVLTQGVLDLDEATVRDFHDRILPRWTDPDLRNKLQAMLKK
jgi:enoyl-CoA hydratase/carnithine racemase